MSLFSVEIVRSIKIRTLTAELAHNADFAAWRIELRQTTVASEQLSEFMLIVVALWYRAEVEYKTEKIKLQRRKALRCFFVHLGGDGHNVRLLPIRLLDRSLLKGKGRK